MKRFFRLCLSLGALLLIGTLSACASQPSSTAHQRTTVTFWHGTSGASQQTLNQMIKDFNNSQSTYKVVGSSQGDFANVQQKITAAAKSHTLPTMAQTTYTNVPNYVRGGFVTPIDPYLSKQTLGKIDPSFQSATRYQGKTYALPFSKSIRVLYYNRDLLKKTNTKVPQTWSDVAKAGNRAKAQGLTGMAFDQSLSSELDSLAQATGTPLYQHHPKLTSPEITGATHVLYDMLQAKTATTAGTDGFGNVTFFKGKTLFYSGSSAALSIMQASTPKGLHWGTAPQPSYQGKHRPAIAGNDLVLFRSASKAQRKGAAAFMQFLLAKKQTLKWAKATGYLPLTTTALKSQNYQEYLKQHPLAKAAAQSLPDGFLDPTLVGYTQYQADVNQMLDQLSSGQTTPEKGLAKLQQQAKTDVSNQ
ncbi:ABC transporter substrate-binding protein [Levilactobacillus tangyuanensis]|uniref:ABC transporter substrate-binding protein n=1 Tax=Levilactobacillus tangyuanensis TaxID=2486021 RepID=A0ABW1TQ50_9LACO|nr:ABC transporter substrate-binding protein [Levilactobacillus tangyuanensis]